MNKFLKTLKYRENDVHSSDSSSICNSFSHIYSISIDTLPQHLITSNHQCSTLQEQKTMFAFPSQLGLTKLFLPRTLSLSLSLGLCLHGQRPVLLQRGQRGEGKNKTLICFFALWSSSWSSHSSFTKGGKISSVFFHSSNPMLK